MPRIDYCNLGVSLLKTTFMETSIGHSNMIVCAISLWFSTQAETEQQCTSNPGEPYRPKTKATSQATDGQRCHKQRTPRRTISHCHTHSRSVAHGLTSAAVVASWTDGTNVMHVRQWLAQCSHTIVTGTAVIDVEVVSSGPQVQFHHLCSPPKYMRATFP
eukprot:m.1226020 g.1226020  ORF g.1226020 m.1226020 type:complete len:160 (+) comp24635_c0_seq17:1605-2084(+)